MAIFSISEKWSNLLPIPLAPLWQVIYYEGIHKHHILFSKHDLAQFEQIKSVKTNSTQHADLTKLTEIGLKLVSCPSLQDMIRLIDSLSLEEKAHVFQLYQCWLNETALMLRQQAH